MKDVILPNGTIGMLGSGQLGRMFILAAKRLGYRVIVFAPDAVNSPAGQVADGHIQATYDDFGALAKFAADVDVVTYEFENVPAETTAFLQDKDVYVRPNANLLATARNRLKEKTFAASLGIQPTPFWEVNNLHELERAMADVADEFDGHAVLKTAEEGYDGKGQWRLGKGSNLPEIMKALNGKPAVLEAFVDLEKEISVVAARGLDGAFAHYGAIENVHKNHILHVSVSPADVPAVLADEAVAATQKLMDALEVAGVLCVEFFVTTDGKLLFNEMAPRPHNSGHLTMEGFATCQFEQQVRAVCGLPLGAVTRTQDAAAMVNILGDAWPKTEQSAPDWAGLMAKFPDVKLHLYGKAEARAGRKMGHMTCTAETGEAARQKVLAALAVLG